MKNVVLMGFMGTGKTQIGKLLADKFNYTFIDINQQIEDALDMSMIQIFKTFNEDQILELEQAAINDVQMNRNLIIALPYNAVDNENCIRLLKYNGFFVWLRSSFIYLMRNIVKDEDENKVIRPVLNNYSQSNNFIKCKKGAVAQRLLTNYDLKYNVVADYMFDIVDKEPNIVFNQLSNYLHKNMIV